MQPARPKGVPREEWNAMSNKKKARFLNFNVQTTQNNSGTQQYGVGGSIKAGKGSRNLSRSMTSAMGGPSQGDVFGSRRAVVMKTSGANPDRPHLRRELIANVLAPDPAGGFGATQYPIQPANETVFPWIGSIARKYQKWRCRKLTLEYIPTVDGFAEPGRQGRVVLAANYDSLDSALTTLQQAETISPNAPGQPDERLTLVMSPYQVSATPKLIRPGQVPAGGTITAFDGGVFYVVVDGLDASVTPGTKLGELFVHYDFDFYDPIIPGMSITPAPTHSSLISSNFDGVVVYTTGAYTAFPAMYAKWNGLNIGIDNTTGFLQFPPGRYAIQCSFMVVSTGNITAMHNRMANISGTAVPNTERKADWNAAVSLRTHTATWVFAIEVTTPDFIMSPEYFLAFAGTATPIGTQEPQLLITTV